MASHAAAPAPDPGTATRLGAVAVDIADLTVIRGKNAALRDLSCQMRCGEITGLLGPSGSGKTTLIRSIVGAQRIASGRVTVFGKPAGAPELRRRLGYVTQAPSIYEDLTVAENVRYFAAVMGADRAHTEQLLRDLDLNEAANQLARNLSGGQRARASLACALVGEPDLLVLDEPTVGQDPVLREQLWAAFRQRAERGAAVIVSSHVMDEASRCDRLLLIRDGAVLAAGTPDEIREEAGTADMDAAFLTLIRRAGGGEQG